MRKFVKQDHADLTLCNRQEVSSFRAQLAAEGEAYQHS